MVRLQTERAGELDNARRTVEKCEGVLRQCSEFFARQAEMNAAAHLSTERVMYPPIHSAIASTLKGISMFQEAYPDAIRGE